jgi:hypothetical protein
MVDALLLDEAGALGEPVEVVIVPPPCVNMGRTPDSRKIKPITAATVLIARKERCM